MKNNVLHEKKEKCILSEPLLKELLMVMNKYFIHFHYIYLTGIIRIAMQKFKILVHFESMSLAGLVSPPVIVILFFGTILRLQKNCLRPENQSRPGVQ